MRDCVLPPPVGFLLLLLLLLTLSLIFLQGHISLQSRLRSQVQTSTLTKRRSAKDRRLQRLGRWPMKRLSLALVLFLPLPLLLLLHEALLLSPSFYVERLPLTKPVLLLTFTLRDEHLFLSQMIFATEPSTVQAREGPAKRSVVRVMRVVLRLTFTRERRRLLASVWVRLQRRLQSLPRLVRTRLLLTG